MSDFKQFEKDAWEEKASRYDGTWGKVSTQSIEAILECISPLTGRSFLDCGCGPGRLCGAAAQFGAVVTGADYSERMVEIARENYPDISFQVEDAEKLSFADETFDIVTMNYLLLHVADQEGAILEGRRVLKPGGTYLYSMWLGPGASAGVKLMFDAVREYADMSVIPPAQDIFTFSYSDYAQSFFEQNNFVEIEMKTVDTHWDVDSADSFFQIVQAGTRIGGTIQLQSPEVKQKIQEKITVDIEAFRDGERYHIPTPSLVVSAKKKS